MIAFFEMAMVNYGMSLNARCEKAEAERKAISLRTNDGIQMIAEPGADGGDPDETEEKGGGKQNYTGGIHIKLADRKAAGSTMIKLARSMKVCK